MTLLRDLDASFVRHTGGGDYEEVPTRDGANGVYFDCPKCGRHGLLIWDRTIPAGVKPGPGRWDFYGDTLDNLTLHPSIDISTVACGWHGWVKNGNAE